MTGRVTGAAARIRCILRSFGSPADYSRSIPFAGFARLSEKATQKSHEPRPDTRSHLNLWLELAAKSLNESLSNGICELVYHVTGKLAQPSHNHDVRGKQDARTVSAYLKLETNANDLALVGVAVRVTVGRKDMISAARVVLGGGLNDTLVRSSAAEAVLDCEQASEELFQRAAHAIAGDIDPISDHRCSAEYRATIGRVYVARALQQAIQRLD